MSTSAASKAARQAASLRSNDQLALAGLVEGRVSTVCPRRSVMRRCRADSPPLWASTRRSGERAIKPGRSLSWASRMALSSVLVVSNALRLKHWTPQLALAKGQP